MFKTSLQLEAYTDSTFKLINPLVYEGSDEDFRLPAGFVTDFATVPSALTWLIPTYGKYTKAAVVHDFLCDRLNREHAGNRLKPRIVVNPPASGRDTDGIFRRIMRELEVPFPRRWLMWCGVRWGALANPARRAGWYKDFPLVLLISLISSPIVIPVTILVWLGQLVDKLVEKL